MQNILIIGAGDFQLPLVQRASQSYNVLLAAPVISDAFKPYITDSLLIDVRDEEAILAYAREHSICGVITDQTDIAVRSVAYVAENLGLPGIGSETGRLFTDKSLMRDRMAQLGIKLLPHRTVSSEKEGLQFYREIGGDIIIKPLDTQGSRGVQICRGEEELRSKYAEAARWSSNHQVLIERYATGREFVVEGIAVDYEFQNACIGDTLYFDLPDAFAAKSRIFPTTADDELRQRVLDLNTKTCILYSDRQGPECTGRRGSAGPSLCSPKSARQAQSRHRKQRRPHRQDIPAGSDHQRAGPRYFQRACRARPRTASGRD